MSESLHNVDDLFKKALDEHEEIPPSSTWDVIDKSLDKNTVIFISKKYYKLKWAAASLLILSFGMAMYTLYIRKENRQFVKNIKIEKVKTSGNSNHANNTLNHTDSQDIAVAQQTTQPNDAKTGQDVQSARLSEDSIGKQNQQSLQQKFLQKTNARQKHLQPNSYAANETVPLLVSGTIHHKQSKSAETIIDLSTKKEMLTKSNNKSASGIMDISFEKNITNVFTAPGMNKDLLFSKAMLSSPLLNENAKDEPVKSKSTFLNKKTVIHQASKGYFSATAYYSPDAASTSLDNDHPHFREEDKDEIKKYEKIKYASTFGVMLNYNLNKKWIIASGISLVTRVSYIMPKNIYARPDNMGNFHYRINCDAGYSYVPVKDANGNLPTQGDSISTPSSKNTLSYIKIPVMIRYPFIKNRWSFIPAAGVAVNFLNKRQIETNIAAQNGDKTTNFTTVQGLKPSYYNGSLSVAVQYDFNKTIAVSFEPTSRFALSSINKDVQVKTYYNSIGFATGIVIKL